MAKKFGKSSKTAKWQKILVKLAKQQNSKTFWSSYQNSKMAKDIAQVSKTTLYFDQMAKLIQRRLF